MLKFLPPKIVSFLMFRVFSNSNSLVVSSSLSSEQISLSSLSLSLSLSLSYQRIRMSVLDRFPHSTAELKRVKTVQFGVLSPDEIVRLLVFLSLNMK